MTDTIELSHWINGERVSADRPGESLNPSDTREVVARTPDGGEAEVNAAVAAAKAHPIAARAPNTTTMPTLPCNCAKARLQAFAASGRTGV